MADFLPALEDVGPPAPATRAKAPALAIEPVRDKRGMRAFFDATRRVYAGDPNWVQPLTFERLQHLEPKRNPFLRNIEMACWVARLGGEPVGRISAQVNAEHLRLHCQGKPKVGHFGFFECVDDQDAARLLLETAEIWLRARGMERAEGPFSPSINDECGTLVEGFSTPPVMMMPHGAPHLAAALAENGYEKVKDLIAYDFDVAGPWPPGAERLIKRVERNPKVSIRHLDMGRYQDEIALLVDIFNDAWSENWGFIPFGDEEARYLADSLKPLVRSDMFAVGELDGEPVAMTVTLPNLNEAIRDLDGRLLPFGWAKLPWRLKVGGVRTARMPLMGLRKRLQGTPTGAALTLGVIDAVKSAAAARGVERAELSWLLEDNRHVRQLVETVGAVSYKTYRIYGKDIT